MNRLLDSCGFTVIEVDVGKVRGTDHQHGRTTTRVDTQDALTIGKMWRDFVHVAGHLSAKLGSVPRLQVDGCVVSHEVRFGLGQEVFMVPILAISGRLDFGVANVGCVRRAAT